MDGGLKSKWEEKMAVALHSSHEEEERKRERERERERERGEIGTELFVQQKREIGKRKLVCGSAHAAPTEKGKQA